MRALLHLFFTALLPCHSSLSQMVVRGDTVETKQEAEWTVIPEEAAPSQEELSSEQEVPERYSLVSHLGFN